jgi:aquaporin Z
MAYAIGHISDCHLNPAVSVGLAVGKRFAASELPAYIGAQLVGGVAAAGVLYLIASGKPRFELAGLRLADSECTLLAATRLRRA